MIGRLSHDVFNSSRLLFPGNSLRIQLDRSSPEFALIRKEGVADNYKIHWLDARCTVTRVRVSEQISRETERQLRLGKQIYLPFTRTDCRAFEIPLRSRNYRANALFSGPLPDRVLLILQDTNAISSGEYSTNPVIFPAAKYKLCEVQFLVDERQVLPQPYRPEWTNKNFLYEYQSLLSVMNLDGSLVGSSMDFNHFATDYGIFAANLRGFEGKERGNVSVQLAFSTGLQSAAAGLMICEYRSCVILDQDKNVSQSDY